MSNDPTDASQDEAEETTEYTRLEQAHYQAIREAERDVADLLLNAEDAKTTASAAKKSFETADASLRALIRRGADVQGTLPGMDGSEDAWRHLPLSEMNIDGALHDNLVEADIKTIGDLSDVMNDRGVTWHNTITGVGEKAVEKVEQLFDAFWTEHPEFCESTEEPEEEEAATADDGET